MKDVPAIIIIYVYTVGCICSINNEGCLSHNHNCYIVSGVSMPYKVKDLSAIIIIWIYPLSESILSKVMEVLAIIIIYIYFGVYQFYEK